MNMNQNSCAFTGHRPKSFPWKYNEDNHDCVLLKEALAAQIATLVKAGVTEYFTGGADGVDCWAAEIVLAMREKNPALKLHCVLPHEGQADKWSSSAQERYHSILNRADSVTYVSREYYDGCMIERNHQLVEAAGLLLAVFNGVRRSGTGATVNYARKLGRKIIIIDPVSRNITYQGGG